MPSTRSRHRAGRHRPLRFEPLEDRLALSSSMGFVEQSLPSHLEAMKKPIGSPYPIGLTPAQVRTAYGFDNVSFGGITGDGTGQTIAIVDAFDDPSIQTDLTFFDQTFGLADPPNFQVLKQHNGNKLPKANRGWAQEIAIDVEWAHAVAPAANIVLVETLSATQLGAGIDFARHLNGVSVVSLSAAGKEFKSETFTDPLFTTPVGHSNVTFVVASGDEGAKSEYPSSSPNVLSVGGSTLYASSAGVWLGETTWSSGGGGVSQFEGVPSYQNGLGLAARGTPDVSYDGNPQTGFAVYDSYGSGGWAQYGGTSAGTPQWAALVAIADQGRALSGMAPLANAQAALYSLPSSDFHDITIGNNGVSAAPGYDLASGLGSPIANLLIPDLAAFSGSTSFTVAALPIPPKHGKSKATPFKAREIAFIDENLLPSTPVVGASSNVASLASAWDLYDIVTSYTPAKLSGAVATSGTTNSNRERTFSGRPSARDRRLKDVHNVNLALEARLDNTFAGTDTYFAGFPY
jgi:subtilase family serine protease